MSIVIIPGKYDQDSSTIQNDAGDFSVHNKITLLTDEFKTIHPVLLHRCNFTP
jgi:hypothetical protein